jgi:hypothetical protein
MISHVWVLTVNSGHKGILIDVFATEAQALDYAEGYDITRKELKELKEQGEVVPERFYYSISITKHEIQGIDDEAQAV